MLVLECQQEPGKMIDGKIENVLKRLKRSENKSGYWMPGSSLTWEQAFTRRFSDPRNVQAGGVVPNVGLPTQPLIVTPR